MLYKLMVGEDIFGSIEVEDDHAVVRVTRFGRRYALRVKNPDEALSMAFKGFEELYEWVFYHPGKVVDG